CRHGSSNCFENTSPIGHDVMIAETKHAKSLGFDDRRALGICLFTIVREVLPAIEFDHELCSMTHEVSDVVFDWDLTPEAVSTQPMIAQLQPEQPLGFGRVPAECPCIRSQLRRDFPGGLLGLIHWILRRGAAPPPALPRKRGRESELLRG